MVDRGNHNEKEKLNALRRLYQRSKNNEELSGAS
jgi:hypothetical protein